MTRRRANICFQRLHTQEHTQRLKLLSFGERPITFFLPKKKGKKKRGNFICTNYSPNHAPLIALPTTYGRAGSTSREMQRSVFDSLSGLLGKLGGDQQGQSVTPKIVLPVEAHQRTSERTQNRRKKRTGRKGKRDWWQKGGEGGRANGRLLLDHWDVGSCAGSFYRVFTSQGFLFGLFLFPFLWAGTDMRKMCATSVFRTEF